MVDMNGRSFAAVAIILVMATATSFGAVSRGRIGTTYRYGSRLGAKPVAKTVATPVGQEESAHTLPRLGPDTHRVNDARLRGSRYLTGERTRVRTERELRRDFVSRESTERARTRAASESEGRQREEERVRKTVRFLFHQ